MALEPDWKDWPWVVRHGGHDALYLRSFVPGDFDDGMPLLPNYALALDGKILEPEAPVTCGGCRAQLRGQDVSVHERVDPARDWRAESQKKRSPYRGKTRPDACYWCNLPLSPLNAKGGHKYKIARASGIVSVHSPRICDDCELRKSPAPERFELLQDGAR